jgi:hypothetical protein
MSKLNITLSNIILQSLNHFPTIKVGVENGPNDASEDDEQVLWNRSAQRNTLGLSNI